MYLRGNDKEGTGKRYQWAMVGDTFIVGCKLPDSLVYPEFNKENPDMKNELFKTELGVYLPNCGLDNVTCSWGHDEYLYKILTHSKNPNNLPEEALYIIRFHSLYAHHTKNSYKHFLSDKDKKNLKWLKLFNKYDLYSKSDQQYDINEMTIYYKKLIKKFFNNSTLFI